MKPAGRFHRDSIILENEKDRSHFMAPALGLHEIPYNEGAHLGLSFYERCELPVIVGRTLSQMAVQKWQVMAEGGPENDASVARECLLEVGRPLAARNYSHLTN
jgi:hypothetical protein